MEEWAVFEQPPPSSPPKDISPISETAIDLFPPFRDFIPADPVLDARAAAFSKNIPLIPMPDHISALFAHPGRNWKPDGSKLLQHTVSGTALRNFFAILEPSEDYIGRLEKQMVLAKERQALPDQPRKFTLLEEEPAELSLLDGDLQTRDFMDPVDQSSSDVDSDDQAGSGALTSRCRLLGG
jgi:hypothetical protein